MPTQKVVLSPDEEEPKDTLPVQTNAVNYPISKDNKIDCIIKRRSDSSRFIPETNIIEMYGNAKIEYCDLVLEADQINYNKETQIAQAFGARDSLGNVIEYATFNDGSENLQYDEFTFNFLTQKGRVNELVTQQGEGIIRAEVVKKISEDESFAKNMMYTTCNLERPHYHFTLKKAKYKTDKYAAGKHVNLYIKDIPTPLYFPFAIFPREQGKRSGFTRPSPSYDQTRGFALSNVGWYQLINDHMDAEVTSDFFTTGSYNVKSRFQYFKRYKNRQSFDFNYSRLNNVDVSNTLGVNLSNSFQLRYTYNQDPKVWPLANLNANISLGQSNYKQLNVHNPNERLNNTYTSSVSYNQRFRKLPLNLTSNARFNQNTQTNNISLTLPTVSLSTPTLYPFRTLSKSPKSALNTINLQYSSTFNNQLQAVDSVFYENPIDVFDKFRYGATHKIPISANFKVLKYLNFSPSVNYQELWTSETERRRWDDVNNVVVRDTLKNFQTARWYSTAVGFNTTIYGSKKFKSGAQLRHVARPTISLAYTPDFSNNDKYFAEVRINEIGDVERYSYFRNGPPLVSGGSINFNLNNNLEMKLRSKKESTADSIIYKKVKIFESLNFSSRYDIGRDSLNFSNISFNGNTRLLDKFSIQINGNLDPYYVNEETGRKINKFYFKSKKGLFDLRQATFSLRGNLRSKPRTSNTSMLANAQSIPHPLFPNEQIFVDQYMMDNIDADVPWDIGFNYFLGYNKIYLPDYKKENRLNHSLKGNFTVNLTDYWKVSGSTGYDFEKNEMQYSNFNIHRELHCWAMNFNWTPNQPYSRYMFTLAPKSALLRDLKIEKRRTVFDNFRN